MTLAEQIARDMLISAYESGCEATFMEYDALRNDYGFDAEDEELRENLAAALWDNSNGYCLYVDEYLDGLDVTWSCLFNYNDYGYEASEDDVDEEDREAWRELVQFMRSIGVE